MLKKLKEIKKKFKKVDKEKLIAIVFFISVLIPLIFLVIQLFDSKKFDGDHYLMIMVSVLVLIAFFIPGILERKFNLDIPSPIYISFVIFLYCAATLGEVRNFFYRFPHWDTFLHFFTGLFLGTLGFSLVYLLVKTDKNIKLTPFFVAFFALCFATTCGVIWEIYEYANDTFLGTNMQKYMLEDGTLLIGLEALKDTMNDFLTNLSGALISTFIGYIALRNDYKWSKNFLIVKKQ